MVPLIQLETNKFCGTIEAVLCRPKRGTGVIDMVCLWPYVIYPFAMPIDNDMSICVCEWNSFRCICRYLSLGVLQESP
jgi:hypothetical protein